MKKYTIYFMSVLFMLSVFACATAPTSVEPEKAEEVTPPVEAKGAKTPTKHETESLNVFSEILDLVESTDDRQAVLPKIEALYERIIDDYADAPLAQESYWKLITIYLEDYSPPELDKAEMRHKEFVEKYPVSILRGMIEDTLGKGYYKNGDWDRLLKLCSPTYTQYIESKKHPRASLLFMFAEASYNLGNMEDAKKAYEIGAELYPKLGEGMRSKSMLEKMVEK